MLKMSRTDIGNALGLTYQQVRNSEKGATRIGASRLRHISRDGEIIDLDAEERK